MTWYKKDWQVKWLVINCEDCLDDWLTDGVINLVTGWLTDQAGWTLLTNSLTHSLTCSLTHSFTSLPNHSLSHSHQHPKPQEIPTHTNTNTHTTRTGHTNTRTIHTHTHIDTHIQTNTSTAQEQDITQHALIYPWTHAVPNKSCLVWEGSVHMQAGHWARREREKEREPRTEHWPW